MLCGADDWEKMPALAEGMHEWLSHYVDMSSGIPSAFTIERVISSIEPTSLGLMLQEVAQLFRQKLTDDVIAIDGKTLRGSNDKANDKKGIHLLHAWSYDNRVCFAQLKVDDKSNGITAICTLLDQLFVKGSIVTADALNTQKNTVAKIIEKGAHYVLPVKENQPGLLESIQFLFTEAEKMQFKGIMLTILSR